VGGFGVTEGSSLRMKVLELIKLALTQHDSVVVTNPDPTAQRR